MSQRHHNRGHTTLDRFFAITEKQSSVKVEIIGGVSTFLSLSYIFAIHPVILGAVGFDRRVVLIATVVVSALSTVAAGFWSRLPFVFAPGLEMSIFVAFVAVPVRHLPVAQVLGIGAVTAVAVCALGIKKVKHLIIDSVPHHFPNAVALTMSAFLLTYAGSLMGVIDYKRGHLSLTGHIYDNVALVGLGAILTITLFEVLRWRPSVLLSVLIVAVLNRTSATVSIAEISYLSKWYVWPDMSSWLLDIQAWRVAFTLFILSCYGSLSKLINLARETTIADQHGAIPRLTRVLVLDGVAGVGSAFLGTTSATTFVESGSGIAAGGRTGLTAVVAGSLMASGVFLLPFIGHIPMIAAVGALVYVGFLFIPKGETLRTFGRVESWIAMLMIIIVVIFQSLSIAFAIGLVGFITSHHLQRRIAYRHVAGA